MPPAPHHRRSWSLALLLALASGCAVAPPAATPGVKPKPGQNVRGGGLRTATGGLGAEDLGSIMIQGRPVLDALGKPTGAIVKADGTVVDAQGQATGATVQADGTVVAADGSTLGKASDTTISVQVPVLPSPGAGEGPAGGSASAPPLGTASAPPLGGASPSPSRPPVVVNPIALESARRGQAGDWVAAAIRGQVKLISDHGGGVISNNTGNLIGNNSGGLIGNNSGGLIGNNSGGLIGNNSGGYRLAQSGVVTESPLADAKVEFLDAEGQVLTGADGVVLSATTDAVGNYSYNGFLPPEAVVARVRLWQGGQLQAMVAKGASGSLPLDTASSLGAAYVLGEYVNSRPQGQRSATFTRLPATNAESLHQAMEAARGALQPASLTYQPAATQVLAAGLKASNEAVHTQLETIKAILLAGQANLGNGQLATSVSLSGPVQVVAGSGGKRYVAELVGGRVREIAADGTVKALDLAWPASPPLTMEGLWWLAATEELLVVDRLANRVWKAKPSTGQVSVFAGTGSSGTGGLNGPAASAELNQPFVATGKADGTVVIGENRTGTARGRLLQVSPSGVMTEIPTPSALANEGKLLWSGLAFLGDGTMAAYEENKGQLWWRSSTGTWTQQSLPGLTSPGQRASLLGSTGHLYLAGMGAHQVVRLARNEAPTVLAGTGRAGYGGDGGQGKQAQLNAPRGMTLVDADTLWLTDSANGLVRSLALGTGVIQRVAGVVGQSSQGDAANLPVQTPGGIALDALGRVVYSESSTGVLKLLADGKISNLGGSTLGYGGDKGPVANARFNAPTGLATGPDGTLYVCDADNQVLRAISPQGIVDSVLGQAGKRGITEQLSLKANALFLKRPTACAVASNGDVYVTDSEVHQVWRLRGDMATRIAGKADGSRGDSGDGGPATDAALTLPMGVAVGADGSVYISDTGNCRVRRVAPNGTISTFAGVGGNALLQRLFIGPPGDPDGTLASQTLFAAPAGLAFMGDGRLMVAEAGSTFVNSQLATLGAPPLNGSIPSRVRAIGTDGRITNVAGPAGKVLNDASGDNSLTGALALAVDLQGRLLIADTMRNQLKLVPAGAF